VQSVGLLKSFLFVLGFVSAKITVLSISFLGLFLYKNVDIFLSFLDLAFLSLFVFFFVLFPLSYGMVYRWCC